MPRRKKLPTIPDYEGITRNEDKRVVQKCNCLQSLSETDMTLPEFKILDAYLSKIDSHNPEKRYVRFEKGELEQLLGVTRMHKDELEKRIKNLFQAVKIQDDNKNKGFSLIALFEKAECEQDENGLWQVDLACSSLAMEYIFNIDSIGYLRYRLKSVVNLTSRYSYILFLYLEHNRYRKQWTIKLDELKKLLNCTAETYTTYKRFNDLVLKRCHKELTEKTELRFSYTAIRKGRTITGVCFEVETLEMQAAQMTERQEEQAEAVQLELEDECNELTPHERQLEFLRDACQGAFDRVEMEEIFTILSTTPLEPHPNDKRPSTSFAKYAYLQEMYAKLLIYERSHKISKKHAYFVQMLKAERTKRNGEKNNEE